MSMVRQSGGNEIAGA